MKSIFRCLMLCTLLGLSFRFANAQGQVDFAIGFGAVQDKAASTGIDPTTLDSCSLATGTSCNPTPDLDSFVMGFGGSLMLTPRFGVGAEVTFQPQKHTYVVLSEESAFSPREVLKSRVTLYDFNAIYRPLTSSRAVLQLSGGIGGTNMKFYDVISANTALGNSSSSAAVFSNNHFQVHGGVGVQVYLTKSVFIRPQFDLHYVTNFDQFGSNLVKRETVWIGYTFGK